METARSSGYCVSSMDEAQRDGSGFRHRSGIKESTSLRVRRRRGGEEDTCPLRAVHRTGLQGTEGKVTAVNKGSVGGVVWFF